jgi:hypothetical protein
VIRAIFIQQSVLRETHSIFQSEFSTQYDLVLSLPIPSILSLPYGRPVVADIFSSSLRHFYTSFSFPLINCFRRQSLRKMWPIQLAFLHFIARRIFLSLTVRNISSFLTRSVQLMSILLQHHIQNFPAISYLLSEVSSFSTIHSYAPKVGVIYKLYIYIYIHTCIFSHSYIHNQIGTGCGLLWML